MIFDIKHCNLKEVANNDRYNGEKEEDYYDVNSEIFFREFQDCKFIVDLNECYADQLDNKLPFKLVYFQDYRLDNQIKFDYEYPTRRQIIEQLKQIYTEKIIGNHKFLAFFIVLEQSEDKCVLKGNWDS